MCLVVVAWRAHPRYPLIVAGNRDEFHARASAPAGWWADAPQVLGGRDLVAGGSWFALSRSGRVAVVVNDPRRPPAPARNASRGQLVRDYVAGAQPSGRFLDGVAVREQRYAGFCLLLGTPVQMRAFHTEPDAPPRRWTLKPGVHAFSNGPPDDPWPKALHLKESVDALASQGTLAEQTLLTLLERREPVADGAPQTWVSRTPFVVGERYGTRAATVLVIDDSRRCFFIERRYDAAGRPAGESREEFTLDP